MSWRRLGQRLRQQGKRAGGDRDRLRRAGPGRRGGANRTQPGRGDCPAPGGRVPGGVARVRARFRLPHRTRSGAGRTQAGQPAAVGARRVGGHRGRPGRGIPGRISWRLAAARPDGRGDVGSRPRPARAAGTGSASALPRRRALAGAGGASRSPTLGGRSSTAGSRSSSQDRSRPSRTSAAPAWRTSACPAAGLLTPPACDG